MWQTVLAAALTAILSPAPAPFQMWGTVWFDGEPVPGVTIDVTGPHASERLLSDERGAYRIDNAPPGTYSLTANLAGFRPQTRTIELARDTVVDFELELGVFVEVLEAVPDLSSAFRSADVVARLRIEGTRPPEPCEWAVSVTHEASVLELVKGAIPSRIDLRVLGAGVCLDGAERIEGYGEPLEAGGEYVALLRRDGYRYESVSGRSLLLEVENGFVLTGGQSGLPMRLPLAEFYAALRGMAR